MIWLLQIKGQEHWKNLCAPECRKETLGQQSHAFQEDTEEDARAKRSQPYQEDTRHTSLPSWRTQLHQFTSSHNIPFSSPLYPFYNHTTLHNYPISMEPYPPGATTLPLPWQPDSSKGCPVSYSHYLQSFLFLFRGPLHQPGFHPIIEENFSNQDH